MKEKKQRVNVWLDPDIIKKVDGLVKRFNVDNQSQLIAKAVEFFIGYVGTNDSTGPMSILLDTKSRNFYIVLLASSSTS